MKRGPGALRDVQRLIWLDRLAADHGVPGVRTETGRPGDDVATVLADARRFLWQVRSHLHLLAGRAEDRLVRELQPPVARRLGFACGRSSGVADLLERHRAHTSAVQDLLAAA